MPVIFIHGVNTRDTDANYKSNVAARNELLRRLILEPLAAKGDRFSNMEIVNAYWGDHGVSFAWHLASLPKVSVLEDLGAENEATPQSDLELTATTNELAHPLQRSALRLENLGADENVFKRAAEKDLSRFIEAVLSPIILSEMHLTEEADIQPEMEGLFQALLSIASQQVASDPNVKSQVAAASSDEEVISLLKEKVQERFEQLARSRLSTHTGTSRLDNQLEPLGAGMLEGLVDRVGALFDRVRDAPLRAVTLGGLELFRDGLHSNLSRFLGDVFVYLNERGDKTKPGPIVESVLGAIKAAPKHHPDEPLIIMTHSMGGNILYDILTHYDTDLKVNVWVSVGGQVAQFEEMKLFKASDKAIGEPKRVGGLKSRVGYWLNVYDPADSFGFKTAPVFTDVNADVEYLTGVSAFKAHSAYFGRASFYELVREHIERALS